MKLQRPLPDCWHASWCDICVRWFNAEKNARCPRCGRTMAMSGLP